MLFAGETEFQTDTGGSSEYAGQRWGMTVDVASCIADAVCHVCFR